MIRMKAICIATISIAAAGCANHSDSEFRHLSIVDDSHVAVHSVGLPDAIISAAGSLTIDGKPVAMTAAQTQIAARYFASAIALRSDAVKTGAAGVSTAITAVASVVDGLSSGDTDSIDAKVDASAARVDAAANKVCEDVQALAKAQDALAATLTQFKPFATIRASSVDDCKSHD